MQQTRWLFWLAALVALAISLSGLSVSPGRSTLLLAVGAAAALVGAWTVRYITGPTHCVVDVVEVAAITAVTVAAPHPAAAFICIIPAVLFRGLYGSARRLLLYTLGVGAGTLLALPLWELAHALLQRRPRARRGRRVAPLRRLPPAELGALP